MNAAKEANLSIKHALRKIGATLLSSREVSSQECVYRCMPELWLRNIFPKTVFVSTGLYSYQKKSLRVAQSQLPWVPEVLFFFREERAVKTERRKINLWSRRL